MAAFTRVEVDGGGYLYSWTLTTADHTGDVVSHVGGSDKTVQFDDTGGAWGSATAELQGANTNVAGAFKLLTDPQGNTLTKTADAIEAVTENPRYIRPILTTAGSGATVFVTLLVRSTM